MSKTREGLAPREGPADWYAELSSGGKRTFWACAFGWGLDGFDVQIYGLALAAIATTLALNATQSGWIATATLFTSAFGGWIAGLLADRIGRVRMLQISVAWFAVFTFLCGFAQNFGQFFAFRALMGFGFGGEWAAGAVLMGEVIAPRHRGKAVGAVQGAWAIGWAVAVIASTALFDNLSPEAAWRTLFMLGILPALLIFFIRRFVEEPSVFKETQQNLANAGRRSNFLEIFSPSMLRTTVLACVLTTGAQCGYYAIATWLPKFLAVERKITILGSAGYLGVLIVGSFIGYLTAAYLADRIGRRANFILFAVGSLVAAVAYTQIPVSNEVMLVLGFPLGFFASGIFSGMGPFLTELFPTRVRGSAQGFAYNFGRGVASFSPVAVGAIAGTLQLGGAIGVLAAFGYGLVIIAALLLPETKGRELTAQ